MKFKDILKLGLKNLKKRKGRTFLTSLAIAIGTMLVVTMVGLGTTGEKYILDQVKEHSNIKKIDVSTTKYVSLEEMEEVEDYNKFFKENFKKIDKNSIEKFKNINNVENVTASVTSPFSSIKIDNKSYNNKKFTRALGYDLDYSIFTKSDIDAIKVKDKNFKPLIVGRSIKKSDKNVIIISETILKQMGIKDYKNIIGKNLTMTLNKSDTGMKLSPLSEDLRIIGVTNSKIDVYSGKLLIPLDIASKFRGYSKFEKNSFKTKGFDLVSVYAKNTDDVSSISKKIKSLDYSYNSSEDFAKQISHIFSTIKTILASLGVIVLIVAALGIINTMIMSIYERIKSIGIMRSIGASRKNIKELFIVESSMLGLFGGVMGLIFSLINSKIIEIALNMFLKSKSTGSDPVTKIAFYLPSWLTLGSLIFAIVLAILSGLYPSSKASKLDVIECLNSK